MMVDNESQPSDHPKWKWYGGLYAWLIAGFLFVNVALAADFVTTRVFIECPTASEASKIHRIINQETAEVPIFGASKALSNYIPGELGINAYNYGMRATSLEGINCLLKIRLQKQREGMIIIDMLNAPLTGVGDVSKFIPFGFNYDIRTLLERRRMMKWRYLIPGLRYFGHFEEYARAWWNYRLNRLTVDRGFIYGTMGPWHREAFDACVKIRSREKSVFRVVPSQDDEFFRCLDSAPHCLFVLVYSPMHDSFFEGFSGEEEFERHKRKLAERHNVVVVDWSRLEMPDNFFNDTLHLNDQGALYFSRLLKARLQNIQEEVHEARID